MAITKSTKNNLVETEISDSKITDIKKGKVQTKKEEPEFLSTNIKRKGFFSSTITELRKTEWPSASYVGRWMLVIIIFTTLVSVFLGYFDHFFASSLQFIDCTSPESRNASLNDCTQELLSDIALR